VDVPFELDIYFLVKTLILISINTRNTTTRYTLTEKEFKCNCLSYKQKDTAKKRNTTRNINGVDYTVVEDVIENCIWRMCGEGFNFSNKIILERIDNSKGHSLNNIRLYYLVCNGCKSEKNKPIRKTVVKL
jgi:hypothetical protein